MDRDLEGELHRYVPRPALTWDDDVGTRRWQEIDGTMCFIDISGFTNLSEKLAVRGRIGAEELTDVLGRVFGSMISLADERGGRLLKFGGDALLLLFCDRDHVVQACSAAVEMRSALRSAAEMPTSVGRVPLRMSVGLHTGLMHLFRVGDEHRELIVTGPGATGTIDMEATAGPGEIVVSGAVVDVLPSGSATARKGDGWLLKRRRPYVDPSGARSVAHDVPVEVAREHVPVGLRAFLEHGAPDPEHRIGVVAFVKYKGVDSLHAEQGPEAVAEALDELVRLVQRSATAEGVTFLGSDIDADGGKIILTAGVPATTGDDERSMLRALRAIVEEPTTLPMQLGVNCGHVFAGEVGAPFRSTFTVMGDTVNLAARLMAAAPPGHLYASPGVLRGSATRFETTALAPFAVKGKSAPVHASSVGRELGAFEDEASGRSSVFVGRAAELAEVLEAVRDAERGDGGELVIVGEVGVGKTALASRALEQTDMAVLPIRAEPNGVATPYRAFRDGVRRLLGIERDHNDVMAEALRAAVQGAAPHLLPLLPLIGAVAHVDVAPTEVSRRIEAKYLPDRTADCFIELSAAVAPGPAVLLVEDAHWMDDASSHLLERIGEAAAEHRWLVLVTRRDDGGGYLPDQASTVPLGPLDDTEARELVNIMTGSSPLRPDDVTSIVQRCRGNPLFLVEVLTALREVDDLDELPDSLRAVVAVQVDRLPPAARRVVRYASVLGVTVRTETMRDMIAAEELVLDGPLLAQMEQVLERDGDDLLRFRNSVLRDAAYDSLSYRKRRELHSRAADAVRSRAEEGADAAADVLSMHSFLAERWADTWRYAVEAGRRAQEQAANRAAATHYERALEASRRIDGIDAADLVEVWVRLGDVRQAAGLFDRCLQAYERASRLVGDRPVELARLTLLRARAHERAGDFGRALRATARARALLRDDDTEEARRLEARILSFRASVYVAQERPRQALQVASDAASAALVSEELEGLGRAYWVVDWANRLLGRPADRHYGVEALAIFEELDDLEGQAMVSGNLGFEAYFTGDWEAALAHQERARDTFRQLGNTVGAAMTSVNAAEILVSQRRSDEARAILVEEVRTLRASGFIDGATFAELQLARADLIDGDADAAARRLDDLIEELTELGLSTSVLEATVYRAECDIAQREPERARTRLEEAVSAVGQEAEVYRVSAARVLGLALASQGCAEDSRAVLSGAVEAARDQGLQYELAVLLDAVDRATPGGDEAARREADDLMVGLGIALTGATTAEAERSTVVREAAL